MASYRILALSITMALSLPSPSTSSLPTSLSTLSSMALAGTAVASAASDIEQGRQRLTSEPRHHRRRRDQPGNKNQNSITNAVNKTLLENLLPSSRQLLQEESETEVGLVNKYPAKDDDYYNKNNYNDANYQDGLAAEIASATDAKKKDRETKKTSKKKKKKMLIFSEEQCSPIGECELCPHHWKSLWEREQDEQEERGKNIFGGATKKSSVENGEYGSCVKYGRRQQFECTVLVHEDGSSEKSARNHMEYKPCMYTESDEQFRMLRMQMICLLVGFWSMRVVRRQKMASASLFDQRRLRRNIGSGSTGGSSANSNDRGGDESRRKYTLVSRDDSMETVTMGNGTGKVPKSPAPNNLQTV